MSAKQVKRTFQLISPSRNSGSNLPYNNNNNKNYNNEELSEDDDTKYYVGKFHHTKTNLAASGSVNGSGGVKSVKTKSGFVFRVGSGRNVNSTSPVTPIPRDANKENSPKEPNLNKRESEFSPLRKADSPSKFMSHGFDEYPMQPLLIHGKRMLQKSMKLTSKKSPKKMESQNKGNNSNLVVLDSEDNETHQPSIFKAGPLKANEENQIVSIKDDEFADLENYFDDFAENSEDLEIIHNNNSHSAKKELESQTQEIRVSKANRRKIKVTSSSPMQAESSSSDSDFSSNGNKKSGLNNDDEEASFSSHSHYMIDPISNRMKKNLTSKKSSIMAGPSAGLKRQSLGLRNRPRTSYNEQKKFEELGLCPDAKKKRRREDEYEQINARSRRVNGISDRRFIDDKANGPGSDRSNIAATGENLDSYELDGFVVDDDQIEYEEEASGSEPDLGPDLEESNAIEQDDDFSDNARVNRSRRTRRNRRLEIDGNDDASDSENRFKILPVNMSKEEFSSAVKNKGVARGSSSQEKDDGEKTSQSTSFESVFGLDDHIKKLKEVIVFPILYPSVFQRMQIKPPSGLLFYGPPGTGKTHMAHCLVNICSNLTGRKVPFFVRKGGDLLSKWVGEAEKQLMELFEVASKVQPSIIFFDEIDGIAPVRSSKNQDQSHTSVVSTLLALMDGISGRGSQVIIIGATNRIDSIDPALRRPGRFDYELFFGLPDFNARFEMLKTWTRIAKPNGNDPDKSIVSISEGDEIKFEVSERFLKDIAEKMEGCNGADVKSLYKEAGIRSLRRCCSHLYDESSWISDIRNENNNFCALPSVPKDINVIEADFLAAFSSMNFGAEKFDIYQPIMKPLKSLLKVLLKEPWNRCSSWFNQVNEAIHGSGKGKGSKCHRFLVYSEDSDLGAKDIFSSLLYQFRMERRGYHFQSLNLLQLISNNNLDQYLQSTVQECARQSPCVLILSDLFLFHRMTRRASPLYDNIWDLTMHTIFHILTSFENKDLIILGLWEPSSAITAALEDDLEIEENSIRSQAVERKELRSTLPKSLSSLFSGNSSSSDVTVLKVEHPSGSARTEFFEEYLNENIEDVSAEEAWDECQNLVAQFTSESGGKRIHQLLEIARRTFNSSQVFSQPQEKPEP